MRTWSNNQSVWYVSMHKTISNYNNKEGHDLERVAVVQLHNIGREMKQRIYGEMHVSCRRFGNYEQQLRLAGDNIKNHMAPWLETKMSMA